MVHVAAVDLGASSGRVVLGEVGPDRLRLQQVARFPNDPVRTDDGLHWDLEALYAAALDGLRAAAAASPGPLASAAVDSWAVDYGLLRHGELLGQPFHYRDEARAAGVEVVHATVPHAELYGRNGLQFLPFNTVYQLAADPLVEKADQMLLVPDLVAWRLTGVGVNERTNASTTGLLDVRTRQWDRDLIDRLGLPQELFGELVDAGATLGPVRPEIASRLGVSRLVVNAVATHDTASAVVGVPLFSDRAAYISCGTWGLVGVELDGPVLTDAAREANFTNEGGVDGRVRFLTNVMGLWLLSETIRGWERAGGTPSLEALLAEAADVTGPVPVFDVQDPRFLPPGDMPARIAAWCAEHDVLPPADRAATVRSILESLAAAFATSVARAAELSGRSVDVVHVVGGGALNALLCQLTADRCGLPVLAGPVEATALGNVLVQGRSAGAVTGDLEALRRLVATTHQPRRFTPRPGSARVSP
ncbi:rhamnulokinase [Nocardioides guangzhouensis]|uniref:Rhamnulokinase n=1 Tax=Nocardioides guangzhouensis TaxID=2497878 RepID=A0A4Q4ZL68_9ACTN|nr:rhamnulokinase family protein [Nocardioides guangzhouensis]RYP88331.1 rhamnulokinase [Nocardioides guangzhouensis]